MLFRCHVVISDSSAATMLVTDDAFLPRLEEGNCILGQTAGTGLAPPPNGAVAAAAAAGDFFLTAAPFVSQWPFVVTSLRSYLVTS